MRSSLTVIVSGCNSGPNPSSGLGIARSLRAAFPQARLVGRDFSGAATGLHDPVFDDYSFAPSPSEADLEVDEQKLPGGLGEAYFLSALDVEIRWLSGLNCPRLLLPSAQALQATSKPAITAHQRIPARVPDWVSFTEGPAAVHAFCAAHDWSVWVKGPVHEARLARSWAEVEGHAASLARAWNDGLFVQSHVVGAEVSLAFAALEGELLDAVWLEKRDRTREGKVWTGRINQVPATLLASLRQCLRELHWTGGGELEFVQDKQGELWLIDWNPRFPAWIHGATVVGRNLPAALLAAATGVSAEPGASVGREFVRVVCEVPASFDLPTAQDSPPLEESPAKGKHPSGMPDLWRRLVQDGAGSNRRARIEPPRPYAQDLLDGGATAMRTPARILLARTATAQFQLAADLRAACGIEVAYSLKTNPDVRLLRIAQSRGLQAETISAAEATLAERLGWPAEQVHYNGPVPLQRSGRGLLGSVFADDLDTLRNYLAQPPACVVGIRVRLAGVRSRFGIDLDEPAEVATLALILRRAPDQVRLGLSMHVAASDVGSTRWVKLAEAFIAAAERIVSTSGRSLNLLNFGGGWSPTQFETAVAQWLPTLARSARTRLGTDLRIVIEPGKALAQPSMAILTRIVHVRRCGDGHRQAILDAGIHDVPQIAAFPHRFFMIRGETLIELEAGPDELLGPLCMENDRLSGGVSLPEDVVNSDILAVTDCGAYDASMAYSFGQAAQECDDQPTPPRRSSSGPWPRLRKQNASRA